MVKTALSHLVSPVRLAPLTLEATSTSGEDVREGTLRAGDESYPIVDGIPRFVPAEVETEQTVRSFAQKWEKHRYYREHTEAFYARWYLERYALASHAELVGGARFVLDAGTGSGRDAALFAKNGDALVYGVDTAFDALRLASADVALDNLAFVHADIHHLPFPDDFFQVISCDQVIHHTPDPPAAFQRLRKKLAPGGQICCYVYRKKAVIREHVDDYVRARIQGMPIDEALAACEGITRLGKALSDLHAAIEVPDIPILGIKAGRHDLQRFVHYNVLKCFWNDDFDFFTNNVVNFDWYHPVHCHRYEPAELRAWFDDGFEILAWNEQEAGTSCRARRID
jgi:SAM-dependent methyltransferase